MCLHQRTVNKTERERERKKSYLCAFCSFTPVSFLLIKVKKCTGMSDEVPQEVEAEEVENTTKKTREAAEQSRALNTLTDHVEEKQLDTSKVNNAMAQITASQTAAREAQRQRDKELAAYKVNPPDVQLIISEIEVDQKQADRRLREHKGNVKEALLSYL